MSSLQKRPLDRLLRALGHDQQLNESPMLDTSRIVLTAGLDDLRFAHPATAVGRMWTSVTPTVGVGRFSGFEFSPIEGLWIRELFAIGASNAAMQMTFGGSGVVYGVSDPLGNYNAIIGRPELSDYPGMTLSTTWAALTGAAAALPIFRDAQIGQANTSVGMFTANAITWRDLWVPAGATFSITCTAANTSLTYYLQIELPAENFYT